MRSRFSLFQSHLDFAHHWWSLHLRSNDVVIDATTGNGHDTAFLCNQVIPLEGSKSCTPLVHAIDIQEKALSAARNRLQHQLTPEQLNCVAWHLGSHEHLPCSDHSVQLVVYNLGYLPGGDKTLTTLSKTTLRSLEEACRVVSSGGIISITCYPGHPEGGVEKEVITEWSRTLAPENWNVTSHQFENRLRSPSLLLIQKKHCSLNSQSSKS